MRKRNMQMSSDASVIPITVRQLEAIVRIAESLAKMTLSREATVEHVEEAIRLFKVHNFCCQVGCSESCLQLT